MPHLMTSKRSRTATATVCLLLLALLLAACGSSSPSKSSSSTGTGTSASSVAPGTSTTPGAPAGAPRSDRFAALRECLAKNGITLPKRTRGARPSGGLLGGGGLRLPSGVSRAQYEAALKKCGGGGLGRFKGFASSPKAKESLTKFAACMREAGIDLPAPNTSGTGPIFNTSHLDVAGSKFKSAEAKCATSLRGAFAARGRGPGAPAGGPPGPGPTTSG
jgi:hypothetical protein